ncbi:hypothetical protein ACFE04_018663 [Oxalis oulophora]
MIYRKWSMLSATAILTGGIGAAVIVSNFLFIENEFAKRRSTDANLDAFLRDIAQACSELSPAGLCIISFFLEIGREAYVEIGSEAYDLVLMYSPLQLHIKNKAWPRTQPKLSRPTSVMWWPCHIQAEATSIHDKHLQTTFIKKPDILITFRSD